MSRLQFSVVGGLVGAVIGCVCAVCALGAVLVSVWVRSDGGVIPIRTAEVREGAQLVATPSTEEFATPEPTPSGTMSPSATRTVTWSPAPTSTWTATSSASHAPSAAEQPPPTAPTPEISQARVAGIVDGDTIEVEIEGQVFRLRYIGIDCPEPGQTGWWESSEANRRLVEGRTVRLERDVAETDQFGRLLRYVYVGDLFVNAELVRQGYAVAMTYPPDVAYADLFAQLQAEAQQDGRGLWVSTPVTRQGTTWNCVGNLYNCDDFSSCEEVMSYWQACPGDPSRLDGDHDGRPCESMCR